MTSLENQTNQNTKIRLSKEKNRPEPLKYELNNSQDALSIQVAERDFEKRLLQMFETTGMASPLAGVHLLSQVMGAQPEQGCKAPSNGLEALNRQAELLHSIGPKDGLEGLLAAQMVASHNMSMEFSRRAMASSDPKAIDLNINRATKLQRAFVAQTEALNKLRRGGKQTIQVQHVNVGQGGQAVIAQS